MGQDLALPDAQPIAPDPGLVAEPQKWTTLSVRCSLSRDLDRRSIAPWSPDESRRVIEHEGFRPEALLARAEQLLTPVDALWLIARLRMLWQSTTPSSSMTAKAWLGGTRAALEAYPGHIVAHAIDAAFRNAARGFTPSAGEIVAIAAPLVTELRQQRDRLDAIVNPRPKARRPWELDDDEIDRCTPEEAARIISEAGMRPADRAPPPRGPRRNPTTADYLAMGVDPAVLARQTDDLEQGAES